MQSRCPLNPLTHSFFSTSQIPTRLSFPPLARYLPSGLTAMAQISSVCPLASTGSRDLPLPLSTRHLWNVCACRPVCRSHLMIEPSFPEEYNQRPSWEATA